jgi:hypothetical protein
MRFQDLCLDLQTTRSAGSFDTNAFFPTHSTYHGNS